MVQSNVCNGPTYFNCCPNYSVGLTNPLILQTLVLNAYLIVDKFKELSKNLVVTYRVYFRLLSAQLNPKLSIIPPKKEETILIQVYTDESATYVPKRLKRVKLQTRRTHYSRSHTP